MAHKESIVNYEVLNFLIRKLFEYVSNIGEIIDQPRPGHELVEE
jgi:hypothetical protein